MDARVYLQIVLFAIKFGTQILDTNSSSTASNTQNTLVHTKIILFRRNTIVEKYTIPDTVFTEQQ